MLLPNETWSACPFPPFHKATPRSACAMDKLFLNLKSLLPAFHPSGCPWRSRRGTSGSWRHSQCASWRRWRSKVLAYCYRTIRMWYTLCHVSFSCGCTASEWRLPVTRTHHQHRAQRMFGSNPRASHSAVQPGQPRTCERTRHTPSLLCTPSVPPLQDLWPPRRTPPALSAPAHRTWCPWSTPQGRSTPYCAPYGCAGATGCSCSTPRTRR